MGEMKIGEERLLFNIICLRNRPWKR